MEWKGECVMKHLKSVLSVVQRAERVKDDECKKDLVNSCGNGSGYAGFLFRAA